MKRWMVVPGLLAWTMGMAQQYWGGERRYPEELREDVEVVRRALHLQHPDPYRFIDRAELDALLDSVSATLQVPMDERDLMLALAPALKRIGDAHVTLAPSAGVRDNWSRQAPMLPLKVRVIHGRLHVEEEYMGFRTIPPGNEVVALDGITSADVLHALSTVIPTDGHDEVYVERCIEQDFRYLYAFRFGTRAEHTVDHRGEDGVVRRSVLRALTGEEVEQAYRPVNVRLLPWRLEPIADIRTAWVTCSTLDQEALAAERIDPSRMIDQFLHELRAKELTTLVIDVRGAGGADMGMAELLFSLVATEPFRVVEAITMRQPATADGRLGPDYASTEADALPEAGPIAVPADDPRLETTLPYNKAFTGKVYVVCDGTTRDAAAAFVMLAKRSGRARVVGEEVGSNSTSHCGGRSVNVVLPRSGLVLSLPSLRFVPAGRGEGPADHGELPHHEAVQQPWGLQRGRDTVRSAVIELIRALQ